MALFMVARLIDHRQTQNKSFESVATDQAAIAERGEEMSHWIAALSLAAPVLAACSQSVDAFVANDRSSLAASWHALVAATRHLLDPAAIVETEAVSALVA